MPEFTKVAEVGQLQPGEFIHVEAGGVSAVLVNLDGKYFAIDGECTHAGGDLFEGELDDYCIVCPVHGSEFDVRTGAIVEGMADTNVAVYEVQVQGNDILLGAG